MESNPKKITEHPNSLGRVWQYDVTDTNQLGREWQYYVTDHNQYSMSSLVYNKNPLYKSIWSWWRTKKDKTKNIDKKLYA